MKMPPPVVSPSKGDGFVIIALVKSASQSNQLYTGCRQEIFVPWPSKDHGQAWKVIVSSELTKNKALKLAADQIGELKLLNYKQYIPGETSQLDIDKVHKKPLSVRTPKRMPKDVKKEKKVTYRFEKFWKHPLAIELSDESVAESLANPKFFSLPLYGEWILLVQHTVIQKQEGGGITKKTDPHYYGPELRATFQDFNEMCRHALQAMGHPIPGHGLLSLQSHRPSTPPTTEYGVEKLAPTEKRLHAERGSLLAQKPHLKLTMPDSPTQVDIDPNKTGAIVHPSDIPEPDAEEHFLFRLPQATTVVNMLRRVQHSVGQVSIGEEDKGTKQNIGTGFLITSNLLVTCLHVVLKPWDNVKFEFPVLDTKFTFKTGEASGTFTHAGIVYPPRQPEAVSHPYKTLGLDVAIFRLDDNEEKKVENITKETCVRLFRSQPGSKAIFLDPDHTQRGDSQLLHVAGWLPSQKCAGAVISWNSSCMKAMENYEIMYSAFNGRKNPTSELKAADKINSFGLRQGMSGGACLSPDGQLLGVHRRAFTGDETKGRYSRKLWYAAASRTDFFLRFALGARPDGKLDDEMISKNFNRMTGPVVHRSWKIEQCRRLLEEVNAYYHPL